MGIKSCSLVAVRTKDKNRASIPPRYAVPAAWSCTLSSPDLPRHLASADLAVVQGGLTTCMS
jgi:hypothetical protein